MTATLCVSGGKNLRLASSMDAVAAGIVAVAALPIAIAINIEAPKNHFMINNPF
jgi:hypothetical protein